MHRLNSKIPTSLYYAFILPCLFACVPLSAQFTGGVGDGADQTLGAQLTLDGIPNGVIALYLGGTGDGFDRETGNFSLGGQTFTVLYGGGRGDGFDEATGSLTLGGQFLSVLYGGGDGDGFDTDITNATLGGTLLAVLYGGGDGDGFDANVTNATLGGTLLAVLYGGSDGDGFDADATNATLGGTLLAVLYGGGDGDGFDERSGSFALSGLDLAALYGGGVGDGFDVTLFAGTIPLPLSLISFEALPKDKYVLLKWATEDEFDTDFFTIEKTRDGGTFADVGEVPAAGYSQAGETLHYTLNDEQPYDGTSFYRLKTTDFDGAVSLSHLVEVEFAGSADWSFQLFPNPSTGRHFNLRPAGLEPGEAVTAQVMDATGRLLFSERFTTSGEAIRIELATRLAAGSYLIRVGNQTAGYQAKILLVGGRSAQ